MRTANAIVGDVVKLVSLPDIYWRVKRVIDNPDSSAQDLSRVISADPAMSARLLRLVNSAFWGFGGQIGSVSRAVVLLGTLHVHDVVLATSIGQTFQGFVPQRMDVARFWRGSVFRALAGASLARKSDLPDAERVFVEGLLSDLGHMILYQRLPELMVQALELSGGLTDELPRVERELIGCDYAQVGAALVESWRLPPCFRAAIEFQDDPAAAGEYAVDAALVHAAGRLAAHEAEGEASAEAQAGPVRISESVWQIIGLDELCISEVIEEAAANLSAVAELFISVSKAGQARKPLHA